mgnify:CR=1 FL=1|jgi:hypothetical protein
MKVKLVKVQALVKKILNSKTKVSETKLLNLTLVKVIIISYQTIIRIHKENKEMKTNKINNANNLTPMNHKIENK